MRWSLPLEPDVGAAERRAQVLGALTRHRHALRAGDASGVGRTLDTRARRPRERDLLVDLVAAEGLELATRKLARFWRQAQTEVDAVRIVGPDEAEVYERLYPPHESRPLHVATVLRRGRDASWRVVTTQRSPADAVRLQIWPAEVPPLRDEAFTEAFSNRWGPSGELVTDDGEGVLGHPTEGWIGALGWPQAPGGPFELALVGAPDPDVRTRQVCWLSRCATVVASLTGAELAYANAARKVVAVDVLGAIANAELPSARDLAGAWVALHRARDLVFSRGLATFALAEVVASPAVWGSASIARKVAAGAVRAGLSGAMGLAPGEIVQIVGQRVTVEPGPRGPSAHESFGRWGAIELVPLSGHTARSGVVRRLD